MAAEVKTAFSIECSGVYGEDLLDTIDASLTVYSDGKREIGCPFLSTEFQGKCKNITEYLEDMEDSSRLDCPHLNPIRVDRF